MKYNGMDYDERFEVWDEYPDYNVSESGRVWDTRKNEWLYPDCITDFSIGFYLRNRVGEVDKVRTDRLVAEAFHKGNHTHMKVKHKDGNRQNCHADNLEWTPSRKPTISEIKRIRPIRCVETGIVYDNIHSCSEITGIKESSLYNCANNRALSAQQGKYHFEWLDW